MNREKTNKDEKFFNLSVFEINNKIKMVEKGKE